MNRFRGYIIIALYGSLSLTSLMLAYAGFALWSSLEGAYAGVAIILLAFGAVTSVMTSWHASRSVARSILADETSMKLDYFPFLCAAFSILVASYLFT